MTEQTILAKQLGMSNNKFRRMIEGRAKWTLIDNKRHYDKDDVLKVIQLALRENLKKEVATADDNHTKRIRND